MGRNRVKMELIKGERNRLNTYNKRKATVLKKIEELCILCDVKACVIIFPGGGRGGGEEEVVTWAPESCTVPELIQRYRISQQPRKCYGVEDYFTDKKKDLDDVKLSELRKQIYRMKFPTWDERLDGFSVDQLTVVLGQLDSKLKIAEERLAALTSASLVPPQNVGFVTERGVDKGYPPQLLLPPSSSEVQQSSAMAMANGYWDELCSSSSFYNPDRLDFIAPGVVGDFTPFIPSASFSPERGIDFGLMQQYQQSNAALMMQFPPMPRQEFVMDQWSLDSNGTLANGGGGMGMGMEYISSTGFQQMQLQFSSPARAGFSLNQVDGDSITGFEFDRRDT